MRLGYTTDEQGNEVLATTHLSGQIRAAKVELQVKVNKDLSYPLSSQHNRGFHVQIFDHNNDLISEQNVNDVSSEAELFTALTASFASDDQFVMIDPPEGESFNYRSRVYNQTAIDEKRYNDWEDDYDDLQAAKGKVVAVVLNDQLRWEVAN